MWVLRFNNGITSAGVSVSDALARELAQAMRTLFSILGLVAGAVALLMAIAIMPEIGFRIPSSPFEVPDAARRGLQSLAFLLTVAATAKAAAIPRILARVLAIKKDIAIHEARRALADKSPSDADIRQMFAKKDGFGKTVPLDGIRP